MSGTAEQLPMGEEPYPSAAAEIVGEQHGLHNFLLLALHQVAQRIGWIFKTESIVMPAFMDWIGGGPVLRACLPVLNRFGFAVPPVLFARLLKIMPRKKWALVSCTTLMAIPFAVLSILWLGDLWHNAQGQPHRWLPWMFLLLYGLFFALTGINQLAAHTLQGKLIPASQRGRLLMVSIVVGAPLAIVAAYLLMPGWLARDDGGFGLIFAMPAIMFLVAALLACGLRELPDDFQQPRTRPLEPFREAWRIVVDDHHFRRLAVVAGLFSTSFMMFPHYQALGREQVGTLHTSLMIWVCAQNVATTLASLLAGPLADRYGNRLALRVMTFATLLAPLLALLLSSLDPAHARPLFGLVFLPIGATPITIKLLANYTLELAEREHHPRYVSTMGICLAMPVVLGAPLVGVAVRLLGFQAVFLLGFVALATCWLLTFRLVEPRQL